MFHTIDIELFSNISIGLVCCCVGVLFFASPLTKLAHVIHTKNTESLPFPIIIASFFVSLQWFIYGLLIEDKFIQVRHSNWYGLLVTKLTIFLLQIPNLLGCLLSAIQLMLYVIYPSRSTYNVGPVYQQLRTEEIHAWVEENWNKIPSFVNNL